MQPWLGQTAMITRDIAGRYVAERIKDERHCKRIGPNGIYYFAYPNNQSMASLRRLKYFTSKPRLKHAFT